MVLYSDSGSILKKWLQKYVILFFKFLQVSWLMNNSISIWPNLFETLFKRGN